MAHTAFYPGSFDPVTNGHLDIIDRAARIADRLVIGVGVHHGKTPLFSEKERVEMLREALENNNREIRRKIDIVTFKNLTVDAAREQRAQIIIRGLRDAGDFEYEMQMAGMNSARRQTWIKFDNHATMLQVHINCVLKIFALGQRRSGP